MWRACGSSEGMRPPRCVEGLCGGGNVVSESEDGETDLDRVERHCSLTSTARAPLDPKLRDHDETPGAQDPGLRDADKLWPV